jgi:hypothetical protein
MLNRDSIRDGAIYKMLQEHQHLNDVAPKTAEERAASLNATLAEAPAGTLDGPGDADVWVFGYGSLVWTRHSTTSKNGAAGFTASTGPIASGPIWAAAPRTIPA